MATMTCLKLTFGILLSIQMSATKNGRYDQMSIVPSGCMVARTSPLLPTLCSGNVPALIMYGTGSGGLVVGNPTLYFGHPSLNSWPRRGLSCLIIRCAFHQSFQAARIILQIRL